LAPLYRL